MRFSTLLPLLPLAAAYEGLAPNFLSKRENALKQMAAHQELGARSADFGIPSVFKTLTMKPISKVAGAKRQQIWYGPLNVVPAAIKEKNPDMGALDPRGNVFFGQIPMFTNGEASILNSQVNIVDSKDELRSGSFDVYNHHAIFTYGSGPGAFASCPAVQGQKTVVSTSIPMWAGGAQEGGLTWYIDGTDKIDSGFYLPANAQLYSITELINFGSENVDAFIKLEVEYVERKVKYSATIQDVAATLCDANPYIINSGSKQKFTVVSKELTIMQDGLMLGMAGHFHDGGVDLKAYHNGKLMCDSKAVYGGKGLPSNTISYIAGCAGPFTIKKGDTMKLIANFDLIAHPPTLGGGMGMGGMSSMSTSASPSSPADDDDGQMAVLFFTFAQPMA